MKICVTSSGSSADDKMDARFGRAEYFIIADTGSMDFESVQNPAALAGGGAGIQSGQMMVDKGIKAVVTGNVGPNAMNVLKAAGIEVYRGRPVSAKENVEKFKAGELEKITDTVQSHFGMGGNK